MSNKQAREEKNETGTAKKSTMNRRLFLKGTAAAGLGALTLSTIGCADDAVQATAVPSSTPRPTLTPAPTRPPDEEQTFIQGIQENWNEPMMWRVGDWPGQQLDLNAVYHSAPLAVLGFNPADIGSNPNLNPSGTDLLFSYNGIAPGPTIRMRGDETLYVKLRNLLPLNAGSSQVSFPDPSQGPGAFFKLAVNDWCLGEHVNGIHSTHTTNVHTHGLHVRPGSNPDGTHSDNIFLRVLPQADWIERESSDDPHCNFIKEKEQVAQADYEFRLGNVGANFLKNNPDIAEQLGYDPNKGPYPHPDGTFWYHPHPHGATYFQVASGMAGFLIVEGIIDDVIRSKDAMNAPGNAISPGIADGPYNYRERMMLLQRIKLTKGPDRDDPQLGNRTQNNAAFAPVVNGSTQRLNITMTPGAVERWRILNGGVDSYGYVRIFVLKGDWQTIEEPSSPYFGQLTLNGVDPVTDSKLQENYGQDYYLLAFDGITLVNDPNASNRYENPISGDFSGMNRVRYTFQKYSADDEPVLLAVANRADILFQAPATSVTESGEDDVYTIVARSWDNVTDRIAALVSSGNEGAGTYPPDTIIARLVVRGAKEEDVDPNREAMGKVFDALSPDNAPVQPYLHPVIDDELKLTNAEKANRLLVDEEGNNPQPLTGDWYRKRYVRYSGWGGGYPYDNKTDESKIRPNLRSDFPIDKMNTTTGDTMAIDGFKFNPDLVVHTMNRDTAEEWVLENCSMTLYGVPGSSEPTLDPRVWGPLPDEQALATKKDFAVQDAEGADLFPVSQAVDHPFHIHQNPFWVTERWLVTQVDNSSEKGGMKLVRDPNWIPRWQDVIHIPRNGGRIVFRSRFWDFVGLYVNHCHLLLHEDNGMMQPVEIIEEAGPLTVETTRGGIVYKQQPDGSGTIESINGQLANYAIVSRESLTDSNPGLIGWTSEADSIWPPAATRQDCFLQNQTALDTSRLPVDPVCGQGKLPPQQSQGLGFAADFCEPLPPIPTPSPSSGE